MAIAFTLGPVINTVTAGTSAVVVLAASLASPVTEWVLQNQGTANVYIGQSTVTTSAGFLLAPADSVRFNAQKKGGDAAANLPYSISNFYVVTAATGCACVVYYDDQLNRSPSV